MSYIALLISLGFFAGQILAGDSPPREFATESASTSPPGGSPEKHPIEEATPVSKFQETCAQCHGAKGEGNVELKTPSIAGLPSWYVTLQIKKFQKNYRGHHPGDTTGVQMHGIAKTLDEEAVKEVAETIQSLKLIPMKNTLGGDAEKGAEIFKEICIECHRYNARGEKVFRSAPLIGLQDWYILSQLKKFQAGIRGKVEEDLDGAKMHRVTSEFMETDFKNVAAYIAELAEKYGTSEGRRRRYR